MSFLLLVPPLTAPVSFSCPSTLRASQPSGRILPGVGITYVVSQALGLHPDEQLADRQYMRSTGIFKSPGNSSVLSCSFPHSNSFSLMIKITKLAYQEWHIVMTFPYVVSFCWLSPLRLSSISPPLSPLKRFRFEYSSHFFSCCMYCPTFPLILPSQGPLFSKPWSTYEREEAVLFFLSQSYFP